MSDLILVSLLGIIGTILSGTISFTFGQRAERKKQTLLIRADMLNPITQWLGGAEKIVGIFSDTLISILHDSPTPVNYGLDERKIAYNFMGEKTNEVLGIIQSNILSVKSTRLLSKELSDLITLIDHSIKYELLPLENEMLVRSSNASLDNTFIKYVSELKLRIDTNLQTAYSLVARIKATLT